LARASSLLRHRLSYTNFIISDELMIIDPSTTAPVDCYKLLIGSITPRPIAFVSSVGADGVNNLAPFSFFTAVSAYPPAIGFSPMVVKPGGRRDTRNNIEARGEFVVNIVSEEFAEQMNATAVDVPPDVDEFALSGLTPVPCELVAAPRVKESHVSMECKLIQVVDISQEVFGGAFVIGKVVRFHVDDSVVEDFRIDPEKLATIGRMGGDTYARTTDRFDIARLGSAIKRE
jgi:flavin reductase (DIM6/NTAB) family NADH-FMN oxidoreductase RutF